MRKNVQTELSVVRLTNEEEFKGQEKLAWLGGEKNLSGRLEKEKELPQILTLSVRMLTHNVSMRRLNK